MDSGRRRRVDTRYTRRTRQFDGTRKTPDSGGRQACHRETKEAKDEDTHPTSRTPPSRIHTRRHLHLLTLSPLISSLPSLLFHSIPLSAMVDRRRRRSAREPIRAHPSLPLIPSLTPPLLYVKVSTRTNVPVAIRGPSIGQRPELELQPPHRIQARRRARLRDALFLDV